MFFLFVFFCCPFGVCRSFARNCTRADLSLGRWPASITCFFSDRTAYSVPSLAFRRAGFPSCASQQKSDGYHLPCGGPLPEHGTTTLASKQATGYVAFGSQGAVLSYWCPYDDVYCLTRSLGWHSMWFRKKTKKQSAKRPALHRPVFCFRFLLGLFITKFARFPTRFSYVCRFFWR